MNLKQPEQKIMKEGQSRRTLLLLAEKMGCHFELAQIFDRYDILLRNCANKSEAEHISILGIAEVNKLMGFAKNGYSIDGVNSEKL